MLLIKVKQDGVFRSKLWLKNNTGSACQSQLGGGGGAQPASHLFIVKKKKHLLSSFRSFLSTWHFLIFPSEIIQLCKNVPSEQELGLLSLILKAITQRCDEHYDEASSELQMYFHFFDWFDDLF